MSAGATLDYLFTWKSKILPHSYIVDIINQYKNTGKAKFFWRCANHGAPVESRAYFLSQEPNFRGIFALGKIVQKPELMDDTIPGKQSFRAEIEFEQISDPYEKLLIEFDALIRINPDNDVKSISNKIPRQWRPRQSGERLLPQAAHEIRKLLSNIAQQDQQSLSGEFLFNPHSLEDGRERILREISARRGQEQFRNKLFRAYEQQCAVTRCTIPDLLEAAHIFPYMGVITNHTQNGLLLRKDIHTLFDCGLIAIDTNTMSIIVNKNIKDDFYKSLSGKKIKLPVLIADHPSMSALDAHRKRHKI